MLAVSILIGKSCGDPLIWQSPIRNQDRGCFGDVSLTDCTDAISSMRIK